MNVFKFYTFESPLRRGQYSIYNVSTVLETRATKHFLIALRNEHILMLIAKCAFRQQHENV